MQCPRLPVTISYDAFVISENMWFKFAVNSKTEHYNNRLLNDIDFSALFYKLF